ncbi:MAG: class I SAM-dependent methyltransferase [Candidatus Peribacteraceae bacterium]|nr:class I SAM-dependent methyltransferase [Candidatus Peribacteraceae bacterium]MDD5075247.1 class I SAM-dependent methyltransferase [Candidatus Peribacteraceae bacterium]
MAEDCAFTGEFFVPGQTSRRIRDDADARYRFAAPFVAGKKVLEVACGTGYGTDRMKQAGAASILAMDISEDALSYARAHFQSPGVVFRQGDIAHMDFSEQFDAAVCFETIEHTPHYREALVNLHRALKPGGVLLLSTPNRIMTSPSASRITDPIPNPYHTQEFVPSEMREFLVEAGFSPSALQLFGQRQQYYFSSRILRFLYKRFRDPDHRMSPDFRPLQAGLLPRDFLFVARKG